MSRRPSLLLLLLLLLVALIAASGKPVAVVKTVRDELSKEAQRNTLLALVRLAELLGAEVRAQAQLPEDELPPASGGVIWLPIPGAMLGDPRSRELLAWVAAGGTLVIAPREPHRWTEDLLLADAAITYTLLAEDDGLAADLFGIPYRVDGEHSAMAAPRMDRFVGSTHPDAEPLLCDPGGCHALRVAHGKGVILAIADPEMFDNKNLDYLDHALLARHLLGLAPGTHFWVIYEERVPSLFALLWHYAKPVLLATLAALLLWLLAVGGRFGPAWPSPQPARRRLAEHVEAVGLLLAQHGGRQRLWRAVYDDVIRTLYRRHPQARGADEQALVTLIARHAGIAESLVRTTLAEPTDPAGFAPAVRRLEILRRKL